jgi:hypothetical protein
VRDAAMEELVEGLMRFAVEMISEIVAEISGEILEGIGEKLFDRKDLFNFSEPLTALNLNEYKRG